MVSEIRAVRPIAQTCLFEHATRHDILPKFGWACLYHNVFCHWHRDDSAYSDRHRIDRIDD
jgi:hypothetical protein